MGWKQDKLLCVYKDGATDWPLGSWALRCFLFVAQREARACVLTGTSSQGKQAGSIGWVLTEGPVLNPLSQGQEQPSDEASLYPILTRLLCGRGRMWSHSYMQRFKIQKCNFQGCPRVRSVLGEPPQTTTLYNWHPEGGVGRGKGLGCVSRSSGSKICLMHLISKLPKTLKCFPWESGMAQTSGAGEVIGRPLFTFFSLLIKRILVL